MIRIALYLVLTMSVVTGCKKKNNTIKCTPKPPDTSKIDKDQLKKDIEAIDKYIADNNIKNVIKHPSGLRYAITPKTEGKGNSPVPCSRILVTYDGRLMSNNNGFDSNSRGATFYLSSNLILGWQIGIALLKRGEEATFYIPSVLAYGKSGRTSTRLIIPPNANLKFTVRLLNF